MNNETEDRSINPLIRIANALEEILRLVKEDQERMKKINEEPEEGDMRDHFTKATINE
jgi:hypothetical protein